MTVTIGFLLYHVYAVFQLYAEVVMWALLASVVVGEIKDDIHGRIQKARQGTECSRWRREEAVGGGRRREEVCVCVCAWLLMLGCVCWVACCCVRCLLLLLCLALGSLSTSLSLSP